MTDEPEPTPEEIEKARRLAEWIDGGKAMPDDTAVPALLQHVNKPLTEERIEAIEARLRLRRRPRWLARAGAVAAVAAAIVLVWFVRAPTETLPKPTAALVGAQAAAAKSGRSEGVDAAMQPYRQSLLQTPKLRAAEPTYARVDAALRSGDLGAAKAALSSFAAAPPSEIAPADARVLQRDAFARLSAIELQTGDAQAALASANRGLALGRATDVFTVNLLLTRANAHKALGHDKAEADDLYAALVLCDDLLQALLK
ncbi:MAG: hypothetical protein IT381_18130 [Deltaproteobacteria bacterium]|nr:hypothetical protein [Deltaproteobacteria bacterium]